MLATLGAEWAPATTGICSFPVVGVFTVFHNRGKKGHGGRAMRSTTLAIRFVAVILQLF